MNPVQTNPNDLKVVSFHNSEEFGFTPDMGCMYDGRAINGITGAPGINAGESITLPYHVGHRLATNLAKYAMLRKASPLDQAGIPTGVPIWDTVALEKLKDSYLTDLYSEQKPLVQSQTDLLMAKVEEYKKMVEKLIDKAEPIVPVNSPSDLDTQGSPIIKPEDLTPKVYLDKAEVIAELTKRGVKFDARQNKSNLEKLIV